jgi:hypothetical protein
MSRNLLIAASLLAVACGRAPKTNQKVHVDMMSPLAAEAVAGVTAEPLRDLLADHWEWLMRWAPTWATRLGDHRYDDQLPRRSKQFIEQFKRERAGLLERARAIDPAGLGAADRVTLALFEGELAADVAAEVCRDEQWSVSVMNNPYAELSDVVRLHKVDSAEDGKNLVARMRQGPVLVADTIANLRDGVAAGRVAAAEAVRRTIAQLAAELAKPTAEWAMSLPEVDGLDAAVEDLRPSIEALRDFLRDEVLPKARTGAREGIGALVDGGGELGGETRGLAVGPVGVRRASGQVHRPARGWLGELGVELRDGAANGFGGGDAPAGDTLAQVRDRVGDQHRTLAHARDQIAPVLDGLHRVHLDDIGQLEVRVAVHRDRPLLATADLGGRVRGELALEQRERHAVGGAEPGRIDRARSLEQAGALALELVEELLAALRQLIVVAMIAETRRQRWRPAHRPLPVIGEQIA